jgi:hypothetical protein
MSDAPCRHEWMPLNLLSGYLVFEGCSHCGARRSFFTLEDRHQMDSYKRGEHKWNFLGSSQAVKFDLKCSKCGKMVKIDKTMALMLCTECMEECEAGKRAKHAGGENTWVYLALCSDSSHLSKDCIPPEETQALTEYFNGRIRTPGKKILILPCTMRPGINTCQGEVLADAGMKDLD